MTHHLPFSALPSARCACARAQEDGTVESERRALLYCAVQEEGNADVELRDAYRKSARKWTGHPNHTMHSPSTSTAHRSAHNRQSSRWGPTSTRAEASSARWQLCLVAPREALRKARGAPYRLRSYTRAVTSRMQRGAQAQQHIGCHCGSTTHRKHDGASRRSGSSIRAVLSRTQDPTRGSTHAVCPRGEKPTAPLPTARKMRNTRVTQRGSHLGR
jgi:hypothetical protein